MAILIAVTLVVLVILGATAAVGYAIDRHAERLERPTQRRTQRPTQHVVSPTQH